MTTVYEFLQGSGYSFQVQMGFPSKCLPAFEIVDGEKIVAQVPSSGNLARDAQTAKLITASLLAIEAQAARVGIAPIDYADALIQGRV